MIRVYDSRAREERRTMRRARRWVGTLLSAASYLVAWTAILPLVALAWWGAS